MNSPLVRVSAIPPDLVPLSSAAPDDAGDVWTYTALDHESKLIVTYLVGDRDTDSAFLFMDDLRERLADRPQISTDGLLAYVEGVEGAFGMDIDFAQVVKDFHGSVHSNNHYRKFSPSKVRNMVVVPKQGRPNVRLASTSLVERHNLTMRMNMRRFTRLTNGFSKRFDKHCEMLALYFHAYNFIRPHSAVRTKFNNQVTPAMKAGLVDRPLAWEELVEEIDARAPAPRRPKTYQMHRPVNGLNGQHGNGVKQVASMVSLLNGNPALQRITP